MPPVRVVTVCGSLQARSGNLALLESLPGLAPCDVEFSAFTGLRALPHFDLDLNEGEPPLAVRAWREALRSSDAVFMAAPEYGHSLPGALKNAVDWIFASGELYRKPVAVTASSPGPERGRRGLAARRRVTALVNRRPRPAAHPRRTHGKLARRRPSSRLGIGLGAARHPN